MTDASTTDRRRPWACLEGHHHRTQRAAVACVAATIVGRFRAHPAVVSFEAARARWQPLPVDQRDDATQVRIGEFDWRTFWRCMGTGALAFVGSVLVAAVGLAAAVGLVLGLVWVLSSGYDPYLWGSLALAGVVLLGVLLAQKPKVRAAWAWLREVYE